MTDDTIGNIVIFAFVLAIILAGTGIAALIGRLTSDAIERRVRARIHEHDHEMISGSTP
jgi:hypothetical protein